MARNKWLLPAAVAAGVFALGSMLLRKPALKAGDTVAVPATKLLDPSGTLGPVLGNLIPPTAIAAVTLTAPPVGGQVTGNVVGRVEAGVVTGRFGPTGVGPFAFSEADIVGRADAMGRVS